MDPLSILGITLGMLAIIGGNALEGGHVDSLLNGPAFLIVVGGSVGAMLLQTPFNIFVQAMKNTGKIFISPSIPLSESLDKIVSWSNKARKEGLLGLEKVANAENDRFFKKGMELLVDGNEPEQIRDVLETDIDNQEHRDLLAAKVYESMGGYAPTIGIIGAVMGLIHVMENLADPGMLGSGIATAFVATIYGVGLANLIFIPFSNKLKTIAHVQARYREMLVEGIIGIAEGDNPRSIENKLRGFLNET